MGKTALGQNAEPPHTDDPPPYRPPSPPPEKHGWFSWRQCRGWSLKLVAIVVAVAVVGLCMISAVLSIIKLLQTKDMPASTYQQKLLATNHVPPGLVFLGQDIMMHGCDMFNFTSLNMDELDRDPCDGIDFTLPSHADLGSAEEQLPKFLRDQKQVADMDLILVRGPDDWSNKESVELHFSVPSRQAGVWAIVHPDYSALESQFERLKEAEFELEIDRWLLASDLLLKYSMNFVSTEFRSFFLMSKQEFKEFGQLQAVRIDMEITLLEQNDTHLVEQMLLGRNPRAVADPSTYSHVVPIYQWKDGFYMEGDQFLTTNIWTIVTIIASALLMLERGWNTLKRVLAMKTGRAPPPEPKEVPVNDDLAQDGNGESRRGSKSSEKSLVSPRIAKSVK